VTDPQNLPRRGDIQVAMVKTRIAPDLLSELPAPKPPEPALALEAARGEAKPRIPVIIEMNASFPKGVGAARAMLLRAFLKQQASAGVKIPESAQAHRALVGVHAPKLPADTGPLFDPADRIAVTNSLFTDNYLFGEFTLDTINRLAPLTIDTGGGVKVSPIYKLWRDHSVTPLVFESVKTIKVDAARAAFGCAGRDIVWAVADTGIDGAHPHFKTHKTLAPPRGIRHRDFTRFHGSEAAAERAALTDTDGHGTHVAGILAGETKPKRGQTITITTDIRVSDNETPPVQEPIEHDGPVAGLAPLCKLISLKVLQSGQSGQVSFLLAAIGYMQTLNAYGRNLQVHGLNLSLGYPFRPEWFAAGQSPLCVEVDRLVKAGVIVVVAAGNGGHGVVMTDQGSQVAGHPVTIDDPGNADLAITVGSTHRDRPHTYGVSFFSAKGPTADGRMKPDLVAPGERIVSCALMSDPARAPDAAPFRELSGTSMAAPHVSGAAAAFLSVRREFVGAPLKVKEILQAGATDLKRRPEFQGAGLVDLMRSLQSV
jgi:serine protease AprX